MKLIDTHAHIEEINELDNVIQRAKMNNVIAIIAVGSSIKSTADILSLASKYNGFIYPSIGIHPIEAETDIKTGIKQIISNIDHCVAIGEIGLDYQYDINKTKQKEIFEKMLQISKKFGKPVSLHSRKAWDDVFSLVQTIGISKAVFHWYSGPNEILKKILDNGYFVSATPAVWHSPKHRNAIEMTPVESILLETDTPVKYGGVPSEPSDVTKVLNMVAKIKNISIDKLADITTNNACELFDISC
ncbi:MAG: TatD family deoxyribonuclease [Asgard group archaeon]|nr:TatD family deoxyribonuclease [Asgard group archaeon]